MSYNQDWLFFSLCSTLEKISRIDICSTVQVVVDAIDPNLLASTPASKTFDFGTVSEEDLHDIEIPLSLQAGQRICQLSSQ